LATECCQLQYHTVTKKGSQEGTIKSIIAAQHNETFLVGMKGDRKKAAGIAPDSWTYVLVDWQGHLLLGNIETNAHTVESIIYIATKQPTQQYKR
jgi:hypothetical protein